MKSAALFVLLLSLACKAGSQTVVTVQILEMASFKPPVLFQAKGVAASILASAGVKVRWTRGNQIPALCGVEETGRTIGLRFAEQSPAGISKGAVAAAMPFADGGVGIVLFLDRLRPLMQVVEHPEILVGHVLAHEIGHKLLATDAHASTGVMQAHWSSAEIVHMSFRPMEFTPEHAAQMRANLAGGCRVMVAASRVVN